MGTFVSLGLSVDESALADVAIDALRTSIPGWEPASGSVEVFIIAAVARMVAELRQQANDVGDEVFEAYGQQTYALPAIAGTKATVPVTWTASDTLGHVIPAGTQVAYRVSGDDLIVFEVDDDYTITAGFSALSPVTLQATEVGVAWNGVPAGALELVDSLSWVSSISANSASSGGVDAETDEAYRDRLAAELQLSTPRPIIPNDFAVLARRVTGVTRALAVDGYYPGVNEVQHLSVGGSPAGGSSTVTFSGQPAVIPWNSTASGLQTLLEGLSNIAPGDVACTGGPWPAVAIDVEFKLAYASTNVPQMTNVDAFTGGTAPALTITTTTAGVAATTGNERMVTLFPLDSAGAACSSAIRTAVQTYLDGLREVTFVVYTGIPISTTINVAYNVKVADGYDAATVKTACDAAITSYLSPAIWAGGDSSPAVWDTGESTVRYLAASAVLADVSGVKYVASLTLNAGTADITLTGTAPLPALGTLAGTTS